MGRACNLDLRLVSSTDSDHRHHHQLMMEKPIYENPPQKQQQRLQQQQQLTIFYNGSICVCDVTELQARSILLLASREMEEKLRNPNGSEKASSPSSSSPSSTVPSQQIHSRPTGLYMKKSLQRFLQKRKHRAQAMSPYSVNIPEMQSRRSLSSLICRKEERRPFIFDL